MEGFADFSGLEVRRTTRRSVITGTGGIAVITIEGQVRHETYAHGISPEVQTRGCTHVERTDVVGA